MTQKRLSMRKIREVLRLKWQSGLSIRNIARSCGLAHSTVRQYLERAESAGLRWPLEEGLDEEGLFRLLFPDALHPAQSRKIPLPDWPWVHAELRRKGVTLRLLWREYRDSQPDGYGYSQFCELYRQWNKRLSPCMRLTHRAGEKLFVDYAGQTIPLTDPDTGEAKDAFVFVAVLGASNYTYAEAHATPDLASWIAAHVRTFEFLGGVPEVIVPDNLKTGVRHPCRYEPDLNPTYQELAQYYGSAVIPARVRKPRDKAKVEVAVQLVERWIIACLRHHTFFSLEELNQAISRLLGEFNSRPMRHLGRSRYEIFQALDLPALGNLPTQRYELAIWKKATVSPDYHVEYEGHYYSVHHTLVGTAVYLRASEHLLEVFAKGKRIAAHPRSKVIGQATTLPEHMSPAHREVASYTPAHLSGWAQTVGPCTAQLVQTVLMSPLHQEQACRSCLGIMRLGGRYGNERLEGACHYALSAGIVSYKGLHNVLQAGLDLLPDDEPAHSTTSSSHANIRGQTYYR